MHCQYLLHCKEVNHLAGQNVELKSKSIISRLINLGDTRERKYFRLLWKDFRMRQRGAYSQAVTTVRTMRTPSRTTEETLPFLQIVKFDRTKGRTSVIFSFFYKMFRLQTMAIPL